MTLISKALRDTLHGPDCTCPWHRPVCAVCDLWLIEHADANADHAFVEKYPDSV